MEDSMSTVAQLLFYVYTLARPDGEIFYVGKGNRKRIYKHAEEARKGCGCRKCQVIRDIWKNGGDLQRSILFTTNDEQAALDYERGLIARFGRANLCNVLRGGGAGNHSEEHRERCRRRQQVVSQRPSFIQQFRDGITRRMIRRAKGYSQDADIVIEYDVDVLLQQEDFLWKVDMPRRGSGEGSIYKRSDGRWAAAVSLGYIGGKRRRRVIYGRTRKDVAEKLKALHGQQNAGTLRGADKTTLGAYLLGWLSSAGITRRASTIENYRNLIETHIIPQIGHIRLDRVTADDISSLIDALVKEGLAPTAKLARQVLNRAFKDAIRTRKLIYNPVAGTDTPKYQPRKPQALNDEEARRLLATCEGDRFGIAVHLGLLLALRRGEITALRWSDVDWEKKTISIQRTARRSGRTRSTNPPKTKASLRLLPLIAGLEETLRSHQVVQDEELALRGIVNQDNLILVSQAGTMYDTSNYLLAFRRILKRAGLNETMRPHDLRHSTASLLIGHGVDPRTAASILGHAGTATTMEIYTRGQRIDQKTALEGLDQLLKQK
jgi:integrase